MGARPCPVCSVPLSERELAPGSGVAIDECATCRGVWLDHGELSATKSYFSAKRKELRRKGIGRKQADAQAFGMVDEDSAAIVIFQYATGLPLEMNMPQKLFPLVVTVLIALNTLVLLSAVVSGDLRGSVDALGAVPANISSFQDLHTLFTSIFMHGGFFHLLGNMYFLWVTGDNLEERFGAFRFLAFYLLCGLMAGVAHVVADPSSTVPCVGASGAISGMLGAYMVLFPHTRFLMRFFYFFWYHAKFELPSYAYFLLWIIYQVLLAWVGVEGVAWFAHIGGFLCGALIAALVRFRPSRSSELQ